MRPPRPPILVLIAAVMTFGSPAAWAETYKESFDGDQVSWRFESQAQGCKPFDHRRQRHLIHEGKGAETLKAQVAAAGTAATIVHSLPAAAAIEDLKLAVWVRSNQPEWQLHLRLVFPDAVDPDSDALLTATLPGDRYTTPGEWQELTCTVQREAIQDVVRRTRYRVDTADLSDRGLYVDQAILSATLPAGAAEVVLDDLTLENVVPAGDSRELLSVGLDVTEPDAPAEFRLSHLRVEGEPFFPRIAEFHGAAGETVSDFAAAGMNVAWIADYRDDALLAAMQEVGVWATAIPPRPPDDEGRPLDDHSAGLLPFGPETRPVLFWHLGYRIDPSLVDELIGWVNQLRPADSAYRRPIIADVAGSEYAFSRHVDLLAESRHITNTAISYRDYRDWMRSCRTGAFLNTFFWTWVQTEPADATIKARSASGHLPVVIEPEQVRQQVYAAVQAGCRGLGYWMNTPLRAETLGAEERRLTLARLNLELELIEPLLATGGRDGEPFPFTPKPQNPGSSGIRTRPSYHQITITGPEAAESPFAPSERPAGPAEAVMLSTDFGPLLVAVWYGEAAQFCPGAMAAPNVGIVVPGVPATAKGYLLSPTKITPLNHTQVAGGKRVTIPKFDQTAVVLFTSDPTVREMLERRAAQLSARCAQVSVALATAKRDRVLDTYHQLAAMSVMVNDGPAMAKTANQLVADAEAALSRNDHDGARDAADDALQMLRNLQRALWEDSVRRFSSPLASPHAVCFSTLPDHYRLIGKFGRSVASSSQEPNLLPSGDFEDEAEVGATWRHVGASSDAVATNAYIETKSPKQGSRCLRLAARRHEGMSIARESGDAFVKMESPAVPVRAGQVLHVSGWVRIDTPIPSHFDGAKLHDSLLGPSSGLRWTATKGWQPFEMLREVPADGEFSLTMTLQGVGDGDVYFDDLRVVALTPRAQIAEQPSPRRAARR